MADDPRCCGTGVCIINPQGYCWCGQKWDGKKMSLPPLDKLPANGKTAQASTEKPAAAGSDPAA